MMFGRAPLRAVLLTASLLGIASLAACPKDEVPPPILEGSLPMGDVPLDPLSRRHARLRDRMEGRRYVEMLPTARVFTTEDRGVVLPLDLETGACSTFVALATSGIRDLVLTLYGANGEIAARDEVPGEGGLVHACPEAEGAPHSRAPFYLAIEARDGAGSVAVGQFRSTPGEGDGFEGLWDDVLAPRVPFHDVEARLAEARTALRARGLSPVQAARVEWVSEGAALRFPVRFDSTHCYVATARGGAGTRDVDLFLFDPGGVEVGRDLGTDAEPTIEHCPDADGLHIVEARAFEGEGAVGIMVLGATAPVRGREEHGELHGVLESERGARTESAPDLALDVLAAELAERGFEAPVFASRDASIAPGEARMHDVVVGPGCSLVMASASHDGMDIDLYLADEQGREMDVDTAMHATARVRACRPTPTVLRVAVKAYGRDGRYALATMRAPTSIGDVRVFRLEDAIAGPQTRGFRERERFTSRIEPGTGYTREVHIRDLPCIEIAAAGGIDVRDVDLFLRDTDGALVASASGPSPYATVSRCVEGGPLVLRLQVFASPDGGEVAFSILESGGASPAPP